MTELREIVKRAKSTGDFSALTAAIPYAGFLGITLEKEGGFLIGKMTYDDTLIGNRTLPALHGGTIGALLESTAAFQTLWDAETLIYPKIVTITVDYLRSGKPVDTRARATITRRGKRVINVSAEAWQEDRAAPIARANAHFLIQPLTDDD